MPHEFEVHRLNEQGLARAEMIAEIFRDTLMYLDGHIPPGRERSLVVTKLQEACFFAKRAIALDPVNQLQASQP